MNNYDAAKAIQKIINDTIRSQNTGRFLLEETGARQEIDEVKDTLEGADIAKDDGIAPAAPANLNALIFDHDAAIRWDAPPPGDHVKSTTVEASVKATGVVVKTITTSDMGQTIKGLTPTVEYNVRAYHTDQWGRASAWTLPITVVPEYTVTEMITAETKVAAGEVSELLNDPGLAAITDPGKLATEVVTRNAMRMTNNPNMLQWDQAEFANYETSPALGAANTTHSIVTFATRKWLSHAVTDASTANHVFPFGIGIKDHTETEAGWYIWSTECYNPGTAPVDVRIALQRFDATDTYVDMVYGDVTTVQPEERKQIFVRFERTTVRQRVLVYNNTSNTTVYWNRFMLQKAESNTSEPTEYTPPGFSTGSVAAELISAWTIAAGRAIIADATIDTLLVEDAAINNLKLDRASVNKIQIDTADIVNAAITTAKIGNLQVTNAKINDLAANKLTAGTINTGTIYVGSAMRISGTGSFALASSVYIDSNGLQLVGRASSAENPPTGSVAKLTPYGTAYAALNFFQDDNTSNRGLLLVGGGSTIHNGTVRLSGIHGMNLDINDYRSGHLIVRSRSDRRGYVNFYNSEILATSTYLVDLAASGAINCSMWTERVGARVHVQVLLSGNWVPCIEGSGHGIRFFWTDATTLRIVNDNAGTRKVMMIFDDGGL